MKIDALSLREKCGQMVFADYRFEDQDYDRGVALSKAGVGGFVFFGGTIEDVPKMVNALQRHAKLPLLIGADYEDGPGTQVPGTTHLPSNMALGAAGSADLARIKGRALAEEAAALGVRWVLGPVLDLVTDREDPVISVRSFGKDPAAAARLAGAYLEGMHGKGVIGCGKHFPGHGGVTVDSHLALPRVDRSKEALLSGEVRPYRDLAGELDAVMTGHLLVPALDGERPISLSKAAGEFLRRELAFEGLVVTDALSMGAVTRTVSEEEAVVRAVEAGADIVLLPKDPAKAIDTLEAAVRDGRLSEEAITRAAERIYAGKDRAGLIKDRRVKAEAAERNLNLEDHRDVAQRIAEASISLVKGDGVAEPTCFHVSVYDPNNCPGDVKVFEKHLAAGIGRMVIGVFWRRRAFVGSTRMPGHLVERIDASLKQDPEAIVVSFGDPYLLDQINEEVKHYVCAWSECEASQRAAAWAVQGKIPFLGRLPIDI